MPRGYKKDGSFAGRVFKKGTKICVGRVLSEEHKRKISESEKGKICAKGNESPSWKNGRTKQVRGYILIHKPEHPNVICKSYVLEHRLVMEKYLGRYLTKKEIVHHINGVPDDNRIENLTVFVNHSDHLKYHNSRKKDRKNGQWAMKWRKCVCCGTQLREHWALGFCYLCYPRQHRQKRILNHSFLV